KGEPAKTLQPIGHHPYVRIAIMPAVASPRRYISFAADSEPAAGNRALQTLATGGRVRDGFVRRSLASMAAKEVFELRHAIVAIVDRSSQCELVCATHSPQLVRIENGCQRPVLLN